MSKRQPSRRLSASTVNHQIQAEHIAGRIPICLIVGFLGSGKTTLLAHIAREHREKRLAFVVNEFSALDVDGVVLGRIHDKVVCLPGGSIFCKCLSGQFIQALGTLSETLDLPQCDGVVVEASGIADPCVAPSMLSDAGLDGAYTLAQVIAVVEPGNIAELIEQLPNTKSQLLAAHVIVLNKQDSYSEQQIYAAETLVKEINPQALIERASYCRVDLPLFETGAVKPARGGYALRADANFFTVIAKPDAPVDVDMLARALNAAADFLFRAKGFLPGAQGCVYLDWTPSNLSCFDLPDYDRPPGFTLIGRGTKGSAVNALAARLESGAFKVSSGIHNS